MPTLLDGRELAASIRSRLESTVERMAETERRPGLATVHAGSDPAARRYVELKRRDCEAVGIRGRVVDLDPDTTQADVADAVADLNADPGVDGILIQDDVPEQIDWLAAVEGIDPAKDVDGLHPENLGRLLAGDPRFVPCTPLGVERLLAANGVPIEGQDVVIVNHSNIVGKPLAALLVQRTDGTSGPAAKSVTSAPKATVTVCHSATADLDSKTRAADIVVVAVGIPDFLDGSMITEGTTVVDVGVSQVEDDGEVRLSGDVDFESVAPEARWVTPNPGGVGPMTRAMVLYNTVEAAIRRTDARVEAPPLV